MPRQTYIAKSGEIKTVWRHVDAEGKTLGRLATEVATVLMGKHRPEFTPGVISGDAVIITNASKIVLSGRKLDHKTRRRWSGYPGGLKIRSYRQELDSNPARLVSEAILRMVPTRRTRMRRRLQSSLQRLLSVTRCQKRSQVPTSPRRRRRRAHLVAETELLTTTRTRNSTLLARMTNAANHEKDAQPA